MTLSNENATKIYGLTTYVGGNMGASGYKQAIGRAYVFNVEGYKVIKKALYNGNVSYVVSGKNILDSYTTTISMEVLNMTTVNAINEGLRVELLSTIMNADLSKVVGVMTDNKKGFTLFMDNLMTEGLSKDLAFASVVKDYYSHKFDYVIDTNAIIKVMVKYGYEFTNMIEANKLIR
jgi:hypothetical protein